MNAVTDFEREQISAKLPHYRLLSGYEIERAPSVEWLVKGLLPTLGLAVIYGASGSGKTFLALDIALAIAGDESWFGHRVVKNVPIVYSPLEAAGGISKRIRAWRDNRGISCTPDLFKVLEGDPVDLRDPEAMSVLGNTIVSQVGMGAVVILDTLHRATPGADENSGKDIGEAIAGAYELQRLTGGLVLLVHHTGKDASKGMRGHSSLLGTMEAVLEVTRDASGTRKWTLAKSKDGEDGITHGFKLRNIHLNTDADGDPVTSCAIEWDRFAVPPDKAKVKVPSGRLQKIVLEALRMVVDSGIQIVDVNGRKALPYPYAVECVTAALAFEGTAAGRCKERAKDSIQRLISAGFIQQVGSALISDKSHLVVTSAGVNPDSRFPESPSLGVSETKH